MISVCPAYLHWGTIRRTVIIGGLASARGKLCKQGGGGFVRTPLSESDYESERVVFIIVDKAEFLNKEEHGQIDNFCDGSP